MNINYPKVKRFKIDNLLILIRRIPGKGTHVCLFKGSSLEAEWEAADASELRILRTVLDYIEIHMA